MVNARARAAAAQLAARTAPTPSRGVQLGPVSRVQVAQRQVRDAQMARARQAGMSQTEAILARRRQGAEPGGDGGGRGIAGIVSTALKPLEVLDYPRRIVLSALKEGADIAGGKPGTRLFGTRTDEASLADFFAQAKDPTFGFGDIVGNATGNKWVDRLIGLGGDIAFDPLTYVTLGASKIPGATGRIALATEAAAQGLGREAIETAATRGGQGLRSLGGDVAARAGVQAPGLRFGTRQASVRLPGTGALEEALSGALNRVRAPLTDTPLGRGVRKWGVSRDLETRNAVERLVTGKGPFGSTEAAVHILATDAARKGGRATVGMFERGATKIGDALGDDPNYTHMLETGVADPAIQPWRDQEELIYQWQRNPRNNVSVGHRENRVPHILTEDGRKIFGQADTNVPGGGQAGLDPQGHQYSRQIVPGGGKDGTYTIAGKQFTPVEGTIKEANDWAKANNLPKLYEDSPRLLAAMSVKQAEEAVGNARYLATLANPGGVPGAATHPNQMALSALQGKATTGVLDESKTALKEAQRRGGERAAQLQPALAAVQGRVGTLKTGLEQQGKEIVESIARQNETALALATDLDATAKAALKAANAEMRKSGRAVERVTQQADKLRTEAQTKLSQAEQQLADITERQAALEAGVGARRQAVTTEAQAKLATQRAKAEAAVVDAQDMVRERNAIFEQLGRERPPEVVTEPVTPLPKGARQPKVDPATQVIREGKFLTKQLSKGWRNQVADFEEIRAAAQQLADAGDTTSKQFRSLVRRAQEKQRDLDRFWNKWAKPLPGTVPEVAPPPAAAAAAAPSAVTPGPIDQRLLDAQRRLARLAETGEARVQREVARKIGPVEQAIGAERTGLAAERTAAEAAVADFRSQLDALPDDVRADLAQLHANHRDATTAVAGAKEASEAAAAEVRTARKQLAASGKMRTEPRVAGKPDSYEQLHADLVALAGQDVDPLIRQQLNAYGRGVAAAAQHEANEQLMSKFLADLRSGKLNPVYKRVLKDGWVDLATDRIVGRDLAVTDDMMRAIKSVMTMPDKDPGGFAKAMDAYTKFFKSWATATPGFHIRNALSATFMNLTEGTSFREMSDGVKIWQAWRKNPTGDWVSTLPSALQPKAWDVVESVYASGAGGRFSAAELGGRAFGEGRGRGGWLAENRLTRKSQAFGERVEGGVRAGLALHVLNEGDSTVQAIARIRRVHFDYSQVNETDVAARRFIPFWTFMSRNLPLQVQQMWLKPRTYAQYESVKRNFDIDPEGRMFMPEYARGEGAFFVSPGVGIAPDVGATQLQEQLSMVTNPRRLLSQLNPALKVPIELATNQDLFYGSTYRPNDFQKLGMETAAFGPLLQALGVAEQTPQGVVTERKYANAIYDLIPLLAQVNRLGSTTANRQGKGWQSAANYLGVPLRMISPEQERNEILYQRRASMRQSPEEARMEALRQFA